MTVDYLDHVAGTRPGRAYKQELLVQLRIRPGLTVLDVGCGPGTDLAAMADAGGRVIGVDRDPDMVQTARRRLAGRSDVEIRVDDAHALPLEDASVDRARADRVVMHVADPARVLAELRRVLRPGGRAALAEPDWDTLVVDDADLATSRACTRYVVDEVVRNAAIGRQLGRLLAEAGFAVSSVRAVPILFRDAAAGEGILRLRDVSARAVRDGAMDERATAAWLERVMAGPYLAAVTLFLAVGDIPG